MTRALTILFLAALAGAQGWPRTDGTLPVFQDQLGREYAEGAEFYGRADLLGVRALEVKR